MKKKLAKKRKERKRTAEDFLAMLSSVVVTDQNENDEKSKNDNQNSLIKIHQKVDLTSNLPELKVEGDVVLFNDWFNKIEHNFYERKKEMSMYKSSLGLALSTSSTIPKGPIKLHDSLQTQENNEVIKDQLAPPIFDYRDFLNVRQGENKRFRRIAALHAVNHIYQDFEVKENKLAPDMRDSNFTPTLVMVICPHKLQAYNFIKDIINCLPESILGKDDQGNEIKEQFQIENYDKLSDYTVEEISKHYLRTRSEDWLETFGGNTDSDFKTGIRFFKNKISIFQEIAKSQLVIASPLALSLFEEKNFMSSIEVLIFDSIDVLTMQHSDRLSQVVVQLNSLPKTVDQTDWSRVRKYCADNNHRKMRQNIGYGAVLTPEIYNLYQNFENIRGQLIIRPISYPSIFNLNLSTSDENSPQTYERSFKKMHADTIDKIGDAIYKTFKDKIFPLIKQWRSESEDVAKRTIVYFVSSFRFYQARKMLEDDLVHFLELSDESTKQDSSNMKKAFRSDPNSVLLLTERHHFYFRPKLGAERVVFLQPPSYPNFVSEIAGNCDLSIYFTNFDELAIERIVGSDLSQAVLSNELYIL